ncbi:MAG TPA: sterol desaturase family protein [Pseudomonadales bacterium]|nr:sterol desaturase family protein [Pseudomonadales bacterium]
MAEQSFDSHADAASAPDSGLRSDADRAAAREELIWSLPQPILVIGSMLAVASAITTGWMDADLLTSIMILLPLPLILFAERIWAKREDWLLTPKEMAEDTFWLAFAALIWVPIYDDAYETPISEGFKWVRDASPMQLSLAPTTVVGLILCALFAKTCSGFIYYWLHRVQHESLFWWRIHATHHHITKMGAMRGDRTHPLEYLALAVGGPIVFALMGASDDVVAVAAAFGFCNGYLNHSNLPLRSMPVYNWFFATAPQHHLHHSHDMDSSNTNYGCNLIIWDRLFGTYSAATHIERIGAGKGEPLSIATQLALAFYPTEKLKNL